MTIRDRILELRRVPANQLLPCPRNWRRHPSDQRAALQGVLEEVGIADAVLARQTPEGLMLIDGHLRAEVAGDEIIPVLLLDVTEAEADKLLATLDPLAALAETDGERLADLLGSFETQSEALQKMLDDLSEGIGMFNVAEAAMPDLSNEPKTHEQMTFTLTSEQAETVRSALRASKDQGPFLEDGNKNGLALVRVCEVYLGTC